MKKILLTVLGMAACVSGFAGTYEVYKNGVLDPNLKVYGWWNDASNFQAANPDGEGLVFEFKPGAASTSAASMGLNLEAPGCTGPLHSATLNFRWYAVGTGKYTIRLTSSLEQNYKFTVDADNANRWNTVALPVASTFPGVAAEWEAFNKEGEGYVFSVVLEEGADNAAIYFDNIYYSDTDDAWEKPEVEVFAPETVPVPTHPADKVLSFFSSEYPQGTGGFSIGGWGQSTKATEEIIDGKKVYHVKNFNYLGWELVKHVDLTGYNKLHVDYWTHNGDKFGFTPIGGSETAWIAPEVKKDEWNSYDVDLSHYTAVNFSDVYQIKFDQGSGNDEGYIANVYFYKDDSEENPGGGEENPGGETGATFTGSISDTHSQTLEGNTKNYPYTIDYSIVYNDDKTLTISAAFNWQDGTPIGAEYFMYFLPDREGERQAIFEGGTATITTNTTYNQGETINIHVKLPVAAGAVEKDLKYEVGSSSQAAPAVLAIAAEAADVEMTTATINYTLTLSDGVAESDVAVSYREGDGEAVAANGGKIELSGLAAGTQYTYTLTASYADQTASTEVTFTTKRDASQESHFHVIANGFLPNSYKVGESSAEARALPISIQGDLVYNPDQTITLNFTVNGKDDLTGFVAECNVADNWSGDLSATDGVYSFTPSATFEAGQNVVAFFWMKYAGGVERFDIGAYKAGDSNEPVEYGAPAKPVLTASETLATVGEPLSFIAYYEDAEGNFLLNEPLDLSLTEDSADAVFTNDHITLNAAGKAVLTLSCNGLQESVTFQTAVSADAVNLASGKVPQVNCADHSHEGLNLEVATDGNLGTEVNFGNEYFNHEIRIDLGKNYNIECVTLTWEGASAKVYSVTLEENEGEIMSLAAPYTMEVTDGLGGGGLTVVKNLYPDKQVTAQYVTLTTSQAFEPGWGIKLKQISVMGTDDLTTEVDSVIVDADAPVRYFNLNGVEVNGSNLAPGLYIKVQGNESTKILVK